MKKIISILFISLYLLAYTNLREFAKLGLLIEHYHEHQTNTKIGFFDFLKMHYSLDNIQDSDFEKDMNLPFKSIDKSLCTFNGAYIFTEKNFFNIVISPIFNEKKEEIKYKNPHLDLAPCKNLLRPPQSI